jgi:thiamine-monophosphate kinase
MMDISDGLVADLGHLCDVSGVAAVIESPRVPLSLAAQAVLAREPALLQTVLGGGDDYELLFTAPPDAAARLQEVSRAAGVAVTAIGRIEAGRGVTVRDGAGNEIPVAVRGYEHF